MADLYGYAILPLAIHRLSFSLHALSGQTVTLSDRQDRVVCTCAVGAQDGNAEGFCLHGRAAHTLLLHSSLFQGVDGLTATFALTDRQTDRQTRCYDADGCCDSAERLVHTPHSSAVLSGFLTDSHPL